MDEATRERILDRRVQARLRTDAAYRNAADAEAQAEREQAIEEEEIRRLDAATAEDETVTIYGLVVPMPRTWESRRAYEARARIGFADDEVWETLLHLTVAKKDGRRDVTAEEQLGTNPVVEAFAYTGPLFRPWRLRRRLDGTWDAVPANPIEPYITPGFDSRRAVVRFIERGGKA